MVTRQGRRARFERRDRLEKAQEEREFVVGLEKARDTLDSVIARAERGSSLTLDTLERFSDEMNAIYEQAERMEGDDR